LKALTNNTMNSLSDKTLSQQTEEEICQELDFLTELGIFGKKFTEGLKDTLEFTEKNKDTLRYVTHQELTNILLTQ